MFAKTQQPPHSPLQNLHVHISHVCAYLVRTSDIGDDVIDEENPAFIQTGVCVCVCCRRVCCLVYSSWLSAHLSSSLLEWTRRRRRWSQKHLAVVSAASAHPALALWWVEPRTALQQVGSVRRGQKQISELRRDITASHQRHHTLTSDLLEGWHWSP